MGSASRDSERGTSLLQLPVRMRGIQLGRPTDVLLDVENWQVLGFVVRCGDEATRFLPLAACQVGEDAIHVQSPLMLLEDVAFYEKRGASFRSLLNGAVGTHGALVDVVVGPSGGVTDLEVEQGGARDLVPAAGQRVAPTRASAA
jgi:hypothetical protein